MKLTLSIILDETTDISTSKSLTVIIRFFYGDAVRDHFFGLLQIERRTAENIHRSIINHLNANNILIEKLIGLAADNANVMMGQIGGVRARFKENIGLCLP